MNPYVKFTKILHSSVGAWVATLGGLLKAVPKTKIFREEVHFFLKGVYISCFWNSHREKVHFFQEEVHFFQKIFPENLDRFFQFFQKMVTYLSQFGWV